MYKIGGELIIKYNNGTLLCQSYIHEKLINSRLHGLKYNYIEDKYLMNIVCRKVDLQLILDQVGKVIIHGLHNYYLDDTWDFEAVKVSEVKDVEKVKYNLDVQIKLSPICKRIEWKDE